MNKELFYYYCMDSDGEIDKSKELEDYEIKHCFQIDNYINAIVYDITFREAEIFIEKKYSENSIVYVYSHLKSEWEDY